MVNTDIRLIIFFAAKDGEALYSHKKTHRSSAIKLRILLFNDSRKLRVLFRG